LPNLPQRIGVITSVASDAWADFQRHSIQKFPAMELLVADSFVQGPKAVSSLLRAIATMQTQNIEVLVITRGGGSLDDLAAFNDEKVVRAIAASRIPTLVAVGHEKDVSIADLVADVRASTPTNAGQILTSGYEATAHLLDRHNLTLRRYATNTVTRLAESLDGTMRQLNFTRHRYQSLPHQLRSLASSLQQHYFKLTQTQTISLANLKSRLYLAGQSATHDRITVLRNFNGQLRSASVTVLQDQQQRLTATQRQLEIVSPLAILQRGYSLIEVNGQIVRSVAQVKQGDTMQVRLHKGRLRGLVTKVEE
jgi:exodeoxyribonuclease VII large subunit